MARGLRPEQTARPGWPSFPFNTGLKVNKVMNMAYPARVEEWIRLQYRYEPTTGKLMKWKMVKGKETWEEVRTKKDGQVVTSLMYDKQYFLSAARVVFFLVHKRWPSRLAFVDGNSENYRPENLVEQRQATFDRIMNLCLKGGES